MDNLSIREFQQAIINFTNQSPLPIEVKRLCMQDILRQVESEATKVIKAEIEARDIAEKEAKEQKESEVEADGN